MEKMSMINVVGLIEDADAIAREVILSGSIDVVSALNEINQSRFNLDVTEQNVESLVEMARVHPVSLKENYKETIKKIDFIEGIYQEDFTIQREHVKEEYNFEECKKEVDSLYEKFKSAWDELEKIEERTKEINKSYRHFQQMKNVDINMEDMDHMEYFDYALGILSKENRIKLKRNYENIPAVVLHKGTIEEGEVYIVVFPKDLEVETKRILRSLSFKSIEITKGFKGTPREIIKEIEKEKNEEENILKDLRENLEELKEKYKSQVQICFSRLSLQKRINELKNLMVATQYFFYLSGWIPNDKKEAFEKSLKKYKNITIHYQEREESSTSFTPPTKLKNNWLFAPFEFLVNMYGIPSYGELDPTPFLGLTYMLFFGAMFGDVGQGLVFLLGGIYLDRVNKGGSFGGLLSRIGISSMVFGFLYGSVFGFEEIIPALLIVPFENINLILISAVSLGIFLIFISYGYSIINGFRLGDLKEAIFGKNGIVGAVFYAMILLLIAQGFTSIKVLSLQIGILLLGILIVLMVAREPLSNLLFKKRPLYEEDVSSYYIESSFEILETLLSMISSTLSFIRIGAFALTHVGLFMAFQVIADILSSTPGSILVLLIGNIIIIALEGLIVGIQALRLEYYELFSKYYRGEGRAYEPFKIN